jgi:hypothetical protein
MEMVELMRYRRRNINLHMAGGSQLYFYVPAVGEITSGVVYI